MADLTACNTGVDIYMLLLVHFVRRYDPRCLQLDRVDGIASRHKQSPAIRTAECDVRRTDLSLGLAAVYRQVDGAEQLARRRRDANDARACSAGREHIACPVCLLAVTYADAFSKDGKRAERAIGIDGISPHLTICSGQVHPLTIRRQGDAVRRATEIRAAQHQRRLAILDLV